MTSSSNHIKYGQLLKFRAGGQAISPNDLIQIGGQGLKAYPVKCTDYAIKNAVTTLIAQTSIAANRAVGYDRQGACTDAQGNIYVVRAGTLYKYSSLGLNVLSLSGNINGTPTSEKCILLSNGNILVIGVDSAAGSISFGIADPANLAAVKNVTVVATTYNTGSISYFDACALSGGGFAVTYQNSGGTQIVLQTYSNLGVAVLGATNIQAVTGGPNLIYQRIAQLSSGNLVVAMNSPTSTPTGKTFVIVTTAGVSVKTNVVAEADATGTFIEVAVMPGSFAVAAGQSTTVQMVSVYDNTGTIQGSKITGSGAGNASTKIQFKLVSDGTQFWYVYLNTSNYFVVHQIPNTGTNAVATTFSGRPGNADSLDAAVQGSQLLIFLGEPTTSANTYYHVQLPDAELPTSAPYEVTHANVGSAAATTGTFWPRVLFNGDFTGIFIYDQQSTAGTFFTIIKFAATAIEGVSQTTNLAQTPGAYGAPNLISVNPGPGMYPCNVMAGTNGVGFSHSSGSIPGINGKLFNFGVAMSGAGVPRQIN